MKFYRITEILEKYVNRENIPDYYWDRATDRGQRLHTCIKNYLNHIYISHIDIDVEPYFDSFVSWADEMIEETLLVERELKCPTYGITGHPDWAGILKWGVAAVLDWKSPVSEGSTWKTQIGSYCYLVEHYAGLRYNNQPFVVERCGGLQLHPKGKIAKFLDYSDEKAQAFQVFLQALNAHRHLIG